MWATWVFAITMWAFICPCAATFTWRGDSREVGQQRVTDRAKLRRGDQPSTTEIFKTSQSHLPSTYSVALTELQELESEPICHRIAARLLVNNCQLVDGKDETTELTDSGRLVRDFVDAYAASLAICDLERGSFPIPGECVKFREGTLGQLALMNKPKLHVSSGEIDLCLTALAGSDSAWNTWVSYRHKAVRFCEAARADVEKTQQILLYQRLAKVISKLTEGVESDFQKQVKEFDRRAQQTMENLQQLNPEVDQLRQNIQAVSNSILRNLGDSVQKSTASLNNGLKNAQNLQQILAALLTSVLDSNSRVATAHQVLLEKINKEASIQVNDLISLISVAAASTVALQQHMDASHMQAVELVRRQVTLENGMARLFTFAENLSLKYDDHTHMLGRANNMTVDILEALKNTTNAAASVSRLFRWDTASGSLWPCVVFPPVTLMMGSYGLLPSMWRNLGLLALGEAVGFAVSMAPATTIPSIMVNLFASDGTRNNTGYPPNTDI